MTELALYQSGLADGPALVLGHALGADRKVWDEALPFLEEAFRVIRWEQPGHGASALLAEPATMEALATQLLRDLDQLGITRAHFAGISLGGMVSLAVTQIAPERVLSLSMLDAGPKLSPASAWTARAAQVRQEGMAPLVEPTMKRWFAPEQRGEAYERTKKIFAACSPAGYAQCCDIIAATDLTPGLSRVTMPTLVLTGEDDPGMTPQAASALAEVLGAAVVVVPGSRHLTCLHDPELVARSISDLAGKAG